MSLTKYSGSTNTIQSLSDRPNQTEGLTAAQLKLKFDQEAINNKAFINNTLTVEIDDLDAENVKKTDDQTIDGVKTFIASPIVPTPTTDMQASNKKYDDDILNTHKTSNDHDGRYYTEAEVAALLALKTNLTGNHEGTWQGYSPTLADPGIASVVAGHTAQLADIPQQTYITEKAKTVDVNNALALKANVADVNTQISSLASGSPKGTYATVSALTTAYPTGNTNIYVVTADGKWYYWSGSAWTAGGTYQSTVIADKSITPIKTNFITPSSNLFDKSKAIIDTTLDFTTGQPATNTTVYCSDFIPVTPSTAYAYYKSAADAVFYYDDSLNFISWIDCNAIRTTPVNTKYIRVVLQKSHINIFQINKGSTLLAYEPFYNYIDMGLIPSGGITSDKLNPSILSKKWSGKKMNFFGDSITYGYTPVTGVRMSRPYPTVVGELQNLALVRNYGISSSTIGTVGYQPMSVRYADMDNDADIISVFGGTNDYGQGNGLPLGSNGDTTTSTFYGALKVLIEGLIAKYPTKTIFFITPLHRQTENTLNVTSGKKLIDYVNAIKEMCESYSIPVLDLYKIGGLCPAITAQYDAYAPDGLHPNQTYHENILARKISAFMESL